MYVYALCVLDIYIYIIYYIYIARQIYVDIYRYIITSYAFFFENLKKYKNHDETFKMQLYFNFYKCSTD